MRGDGWTGEKIGKAKRHLANVKAISAAIERHLRKGGADTKAERVKVAAKALREIRAKKGGAK